MWRRLNHYDILNFLQQANSNVVQNEINELTAVADWSLKGAAPVQLQLVM